MSFSESIKFSVRRKAHVRCCVCRQPGPVEVHHIIPQEEGGPDTEDNAAPLCPSCHEAWGANPTKRKFLRENRDNWYEICAAATSVGGLSIEELQTSLGDLASKDDIAALREYIGRELSKASRTDARGETEDQFAVVPLEAVVASLYERDYGDIRDGYDFFFTSSFWREPGSGAYHLVDCSRRFVQLFGEETARRVCLYAMASTGLKLEGFTDEEFAATLAMIHTMVLLILGHEKYPGGRLQCARREDGEFVWRASVPARRQLQRSARRSAGTKKPAGRRA